jgi:hypothetical protein
VLFWCCCCCCCQQLLRECCCGCSMLVWSLALQSKLASNTVKHLGRQLLRGSLLQTELERQPRMTSGQPPSAHAGTAAHMGKNRAHSKAMGNSRQPGAAAAAAAAAADVCATEPSSSTGSEQHTALFR